MSLKSIHQARVEQFMRLAKQELPKTPTEPSEQVRILRAKLILEECITELIGKGLGVGIYWQVGDDLLSLEGIRNSLEFLCDKPFDMEQTADGCADAAVVITGTLSACGVPDEGLQQMVDENNLAKFGPGHYVADGTPEKPGPVGKLIKPPGHTPPNILGYLELHGYGAKSKDRCEQ